MGRATLSMVAREAGVSKTTASLVVNGKSDQVNIASSTRERVLEVSRKFNYRPARFVPGRLNGSTGLFLVVAAGFSGPDMAGWLHWIVIAAEKRGYAVVPVVLSGDDGKVLDVPADGIIFLDAKAVPPGIEEIEVPFVCVGFQKQGGNLKSFVPYYKQQINELISGFYRHRKKAIGFLTEDSVASEQRMNAYLENYCQRFGIPPITEKLSGMYDEASVINGVNHLLEKGVNGIILETVEMTLKAFSSSRMGLKEFEGVLFATCGDHPAFDLLPGKMLIRAAEDKKAMAEEALKYLTGL